MSLLTHNDLLSLVADGHIENVADDNINGASIDLTLADGYFLEAAADGCVYLGQKDTPNMRFASGSLVLTPGSFALAATREIFNLPNNVAGHYMLKSSLARAGLQHLFAGWADPTWNGSALTLELVNTLRHHTLVLRPGDKIGQMIFWRGAPVPAAASYANRGQYNNAPSVQPSKGVK